MKTTRITMYCILGGAMLLGGCAHKQTSREQANQVQPAPPVAAVQPPSTPPQAAEEPLEQSVPTNRTISSELPMLKTTQFKGDLNRMSEANFTVMGVPDDVAQNIVIYRSQFGGKFKSVDDLKQVPGMTPPLFNQLKNKLSVSP